MYSNNRRHNAGRKVIQYDRRELERQPLIVIVCGMKAVGKSHKTNEEIKTYLKNNPQTGKKGRKVLIIDFNDEEMYRWCKAVHPKYIRTLTETRARRIVPYNDDGRQFDLDRMKKIAEYVIFNFRNGLLVLEDIDKYLYGSHGRSLIGALTTNRHSGIDIVITHQSVSKVTQTEWQNAAFLRLHHQLDDVERIHDRVPNYPLIKIAQIIVDRKYFEAVKLFHEDKAIGEKEFKRRASFHLFVNLLEHKIIGCTQEEYQSAAMEFIRHNPLFISKKMKIGDQNGKPYSREQAVKELYKQYVMFFGG